jgi:hypothetical protein
MTGRKIRTCVQLHRAFAKFVQRHVAACRCDAAGVRQDHIASRHTIGNQNRDAIDRATRRRQIREGGLIMNAKSLGVAAAVVLPAAAPAEAVLCLLLTQSGRAADT